MINKIITQLIEAEVKKQVASAISEYKSIFTTHSEKRVVRGMSGLADYLGKSVPTVNRWKHDGLLEGTYTQLERTILFDLDKVDAKFSK